LVCDFVSTDVLREIRRDIAENLAKKRITRIVEGNEAPSS
jgi:hypothetical protein